MLERYNYFCLFYMKLDLILLRGNFFCKAKFHNNKYCTVIGKTNRNIITHSLQLPSPAIIKFFCSWDRQFFSTINSGKRVREENIIYTVLTEFLYIALFLLLIFITLSYLMPALILASISCVQFSRAGAGIYFVTLVRT